MDFLEFIRKTHEERKERGFVTKGGPGSGWHAPPKGTHTAGAKAGVKGTKTSWSNHEIKVTKPFGSFAVPKGEQGAIVSYTKHDFSSKEHAEQWAEWLRGNPPESVKLAIREGRYADQTEEGKTQLQRIIQGKGTKAKTGKGLPTKTDMQRAANVNTTADRSPSGLKKIATASLLAARGVTQDVRTQYEGVKGTGKQRVNLDNRVKILDAELKRRGIDNPEGAVREQWPDWKPMKKITLQG